MITPFQVTGNQEVITFNRLNDYSWRMIQIKNNSTSTKIMTNEEVERSYNYFASFWMDYDIKYL